MAAIDGLLRDYARADTIATFAALQLVPENAHRHLRLVAITNAACRPRSSAGSRKLDERSLCDFLEHPAIATGALSLEEDPYEADFAEHFVFFGGSYRVLNGEFSEDLFALRKLCAAIFRADRGEVPDGIKTTVETIVTASVALSEDIARGADITLPVALPSPAIGGFTVPTTEALQRLKRAVVFDQRRLSDVLGASGVSPDAIEPLVCDRTTADNFDLDGGELTRQPLIRCGECIVAAYPGALVHAAVCRIVELLSHTPAPERVDELLSLTTASSLLESVERVGMRLVTGTEATSKSGLVARELLLETDADKLTWILLLTDSLSNMASGGHGCNFQLTPQSTPLLVRAQEIKTRTVQRIIVVQSFARAIPISLTKCPVDELLPLMMTVADFELVTLLPDADSLTFWKFEQARQAARSRGLDIVAFGFLNEFWGYRHAGCSFTAVPKETRKLLIKPGAAWLLRREAYHARNRHGVLSWNGDSFVEVERTYLGSDLPIYSLKNLRSKLALCTEVSGTAVWVVPDVDVDYESDWTRWQTTYFICDGVAFWASRLGVDLPPFARKAITIRVHAELDQASADALDQPPCSFETTRKGMCITLGAGFLDALRLRTNEADRMLVKALLLGFAQLSAVPSSAQECDLHVDNIAPYGPKKRLGTPSENTPDLDARGLPIPRRVQQFDRATFIGEMSDKVASARRLRAGLVPRAERNVVLHDMVTYCFNRVRTVIGDMDPAGLLDVFVTFDEAAHHTRAMERLSLSGRKAFENARNVVAAEYARDVTELNRASLANRWLIEYIAACPPSGSRRFSMEIYDRLIALVTLMIEAGSSSDLLQADLDDVVIGLLPSGRLVHHAHRYRLASGRYGTVRVVEDINAVVSDEDDDPLLPPPPVEEFSAACREEFGAPFHELADFARILVEIGEERVQPATQVSESEAYRIGATIGWSERVTSAVLAKFSSYPRSSFLAVSDQFRPEDTYPWRFGRRLGYLRRPLIHVDAGSDATIVYGRRNLFNALMFLHDSCMNGRIEAQSDAMKRFGGERQRVMGRWFNERVATTIQGLGYDVRSGVKKFGHLRLEEHGEDLGDVDVVALDPERRVLLLIECKRLWAARTPFELASEIRSLFDNTRQKRGLIRRHERRVRFVEKHLDQILASFHLEGASRWGVIPMIVVEQELPSAFLRPSPVQIVPFVWLRPLLARKSSRIPVVTPQ